MSEFLDAKTIFVLTAILTGLFSVVFVAVHRGVNTIINGVMCFAWSYGCFSVFALLILSRGIVAPVFSYVVADLLMCLSLLLLLRGMCQLKGRPAPVTFIQSFMLIGLFWFSWFTFVNDDFIARASFTSLATIICFGWIMMILFGDKVRSWRIGEWMLVAALSISLIAVLVRSVMTLIGMDGDAVSIFAEQGIVSVLLMVNLVSVIFIAISLIVLVQDKLRKDLENIASHDALTGVLTRRVILDLMEKSLARVRRTQQSLGLLMLDLDHFKEINDNYGHRVGDQVLVSIVDAINQVLRSESYFGRYGGEEFLVILPDIEEDELKEVAERVRVEASKTQTHINHHVIQCTISIGAMVVDKDNIRYIQDPIMSADKALYQAKVQGRNQVVFAGHHLLTETVSGTASRL